MFSKVGSGSGEKSSASATLKFPATVTKAKSLGLNWLRYEFYDTVFDLVHPGLLLDLSSRLPGG
jgi:hypothetical protein